MAKFFFQYAYTLFDKHFINWQQMLASTHFAKCYHVSKMMAYKLLIIQSSSVVISP